MREPLQELDRTGSSGTQPRPRQTRFLGEALSARTTDDDSRLSSDWTLEMVTFENLLSSIFDYHYLR